MLVGEKGGLVRLATATAAEQTSSIEISNLHIISTLPVYNADMMYLETDDPAMPRNCSRLINIYYFTRWLEELKDSLVRIVAVSSAEIWSPVFFPSSLIHQSP